MLGPPIWAFASPSRLATQIVRKFSTLMETRVKCCFGDNNTPTRGVLSAEQRLASIVNYSFASPTTERESEVGDDEPAAERWRALGTPWKEQRIMTKAQKLVKKARGASMVEYGLLLFAVIICAAAAIRTIGPKVKDAGTKAESELKSD